MLRTETETDATHPHLHVRGFVTILITHYLPEPARKTEGYQCFPAHQQNATYVKDSAWKLCTIGQMTRELDIKQLAAFSPLSGLKTRCSRKPR